jgi:hypothetical protein
MPTFAVTKAGTAGSPATEIRPICAGLGIINPAAGAPGTLGLLLTSDGTDRWLLSCYHVVCRLYRFGVTQPFSMGEEVYQPAPGNGATPIAMLQPGAVRSLSDRALDAAAVRVAAGVQCAAGAHGLAGIAAGQPALEPQPQMRVVKSGRATGVTHGFVDRVRVIDGVPRAEVVYDFDEADAQFVAAGDSGAVWFDRLTGRPVAMHQGETNAGASSAVSLSAVLALLALSPA